MNYKEFAEENDYTYHLEGYSKDKISFYYKNKSWIFSIYKDGTYTFGDLALNTPYENKCIINFLSKDNEDDWFNVEESETDMVQIDDFQLIREDAERLLHSLEEKLNK